MSPNRVSRNREFFNEYVETLGGIWEYGGSIIGLWRIHHSRTPAISGLFQHARRKFSKFCTRWLGREGSNLRMGESKSPALPLGYAPMSREFSRELPPATTVYRGSPAFSTGQSNPAGAFLTLYIFALSYTAQGSHGRQRATVALPPLPLPGRS